MSDTYRSDPKRAAELACILTLHIALRSVAPKPHILAGVVADMQKVARTAKRAAENACNYPMTEKQQAAAEKRQNKAQTKINTALAQMMPGHAEAPTIELGGDPRGPCARLHIPGQKGDGWGEGFAVY